MGTTLRITFLNETHLIYRYIIEYFVRHPSADAANNMCTLLGLSIRARAPQFRDIVIGEAGRGTLNIEEAIMSFASQPTVSNSSLVAYHSVSLSSSSTEGRSVLLTVTAQNVGQLDASNVFLFSRFNRAVRFSSMPQECYSHVPDVVVCSWPLIAGRSQRSATFVIFLNNATDQPLLSCSVVASSSSTEAEVRDNVACTASPACGGHGQLCSEDTGCCTTFACRRHSSSACTDGGQDSYRCVPASSSSK